MRVRTLLVLGVLVREAFSFWTGHPFDFEIWVRAGYWVARGLSPYSPIPVAPGVSFANDFGGPTSGLSAAVGYLPFWPLLVAGIYDVYAFLGSPTPYLYYFMIKQPIIICDVLLAYFLYRYVQERGSDKGDFVLKLWLFCPYTILLSGIWGMFDAIPMLFLVLALSIRPGAYRGFWAGMATFAKSVPVIFSIPLSRGPRWYRNLAIAVGLPTVVSLAVVWAEGWSFSVVGTTLGSTVTRSGSSLSIWEVVYYLNSIGLVSNSTVTAFASNGYVWIAAVAVATVVAYRWFGFDTERGLIRSMLFITLAFLLLRGVVNEQYALYLFALALIDIALWSPQRRNLLLVSIAAVLMFNGTNDLLFIRYASPLFHNALAYESSIIAKINPERNAGLFLEAMLFWAANIYYMYSLYRERYSKTQDFLAP